jgi:hypothetical protein
VVQLQQPIQAPPPEQPQHQPEDPDQPEPLFQFENYFWMAFKVTFFAYLFYSFLSPATLSIFILILVHQLGLFTLPAIAIDFEANTLLGQVYHLVVSFIVSLFQNI